jgi:hypothetical protein
MKKKCQHCNIEFVGRADKRFCSIKCKNEKHNSMRQNTKEICKEIDGYLHRNREILMVLMGNSKKEMVDRLLLTRAGFRYEYMTGIHINKQGKTYHLVYDFAWMSFTDQQIMIVRKPQA